MKDNPPAPQKKSILKKIIIVGATAAAAAYGTISIINRDADPTSWKGQRSGFEETK